MNDTVIPIFYACDDNFIKYATVSLHSLKKAACRSRRYHVYVLHTSVSEETQTLLLSMADAQFEVSFIDVSNYLVSIEERLPIRDYYTKTTYFRLFIADMFPSYDKAIYIDSDTVCLADVSRLYDTCLGDAYLGACHEQVMAQTEVYGDYCEEAMGISRRVFFNAGLLLINCAAFRAQRLLDKFIALLGEYDFKVTQDEDYLNVLCKDHVKFLDDRWNVEISAQITYPFSPSEGYILHYIMANKPWHYADVPFGDVFWRFAEETEVFATLREELAAYSDEKREKDALAAKRLEELARAETAREDNYKRRIDAKRSEDRLAILRKIEEYEHNGLFDQDVEIDPPTRPLLPSEIDYLRQSLAAKCKTFIAYRKAKRFLNYIIKKRLMIIKEIRGLEHLSSLRTGAILTCNHFNPFDTFALHAAFLASGQQKKRKLYRVIREGNYTSFGGFYGYLMRHFYTLPLSSHTKTMTKFLRAVDTLLSEGQFILVYPEQSMWWNYRKPKPLKDGAYRIAAKNGVPILPCFITMQDSDRLGEDGFPIQEYTIHIAPPILPRADKNTKENTAYLKEQNAAVWREIYESAYEIPLVYEINEKIHS
ncbi:MAG: 1-acyl-sn-glycerol-3-phosphate acyltransferase [Clostridia bacterium]|nr:1-acyl-sn-glycerol-3-phosphate acyltransferase [Clostridia bacterium]